MFSRVRWLPVVCERHGDLAAALRTLQGKPTQYVQRRLHVLTPRQVPYVPKLVYLGELGLKGGMDAIRDHDVARATDWLQQDSKLLEKVMERDNGYGALRERTPLMHAAQWGDTALVSLLLEHGAWVNQANHDGATPPAEIQHWYNGYTFGEEIICNPWSIMCCLSSNGELDHYWLDSGGTALVDAVLLSDELQQDLQTLVAGGSLVYPIAKQIRFEDIGKPMGLYSLLLFSGYLNPAVVHAEKNIYRLSIPNYEVQYIYENRVLEWVANKLNIDPGGYYTFMSLLAAGEVEAFKERLQALL